MNVKGVIISSCNIQNIAQICVKKSWRYQRNNHYPWIEEQTIQRPKRDKVQTMINKTLHRKLKIKQHEPTRKQGWTHMLLKSKQFKIITINPGFSWFVVSSKPLSKKSWYEPHTLEYRISIEIYTPGAAEMLLHKNGKFTMEKLQ